MATAAALRQRRKFAFLVVTGETIAVRERDRLERALLQPERVAQVLWRLGYKFVVRVALRLVGLVTISALVIRMFVVRKDDFELGCEVFSFC